MQRLVLKDVVGGLSVHVRSKSKFGASRLDWNSKTFFKGAVAPHNITPKTYAPPPRNVGFYLNDSVD